MRLENKPPVLDSQASCRYLTICIVQSLLPFCFRRSYYISFTFIYHQKAYASLYRVPILSYFLGVHSLFPPSLHSLGSIRWKHGFPSFTDIHIPHFNHMLYFPFSPLRSHHDLTTLLPPPKCITASARPCTASVDAASLS